MRNGANNGALARRAGDDCCVLPFRRLAFDLGLVAAEPLLAVAGKAGEGGAQPVSGPVGQSERIKPEADLRFTIDPSRPDHLDYNAFLVRHVLDPDTVDRLGMVNC